MQYQITGFKAQWIKPSRPVTREQIMNLQRILIDAQVREGREFKERGNTDEQCPLKHHFAPGLYAREILIPTGVVIIGKIHRHAHVNTISKGRVLVATEFGTEELTAPHSFVSKPGTKRAVLALEETIWTTYHPTEETDLDVIEDQVIAPTFEAFEQGRLQ